MSTVSLIRVIATVLLMQILLSSFGYSSPESKCENVTGGSRKKRSILTFPTDSVLQITSGILLGGELEKNAAAIALAFQQNAKLPVESQGIFFPPVVTKARGFTIYDHLKELLSRYGFNGMECLRKMICQIGETPLKNGLLEEIITFVLSPSKHRSITHNRNSKAEEEEDEENDINLFLRSENLGSQGGNCSFAFPKCVRTPLDMISYLIHE